MTTSPSPTTTTTTTTTTTGDDFVEVIEYQRKSAIFWRIPFLAKDPLPYEVVKSHLKELSHSFNKYLESLDQYELSGELQWEGDWIVEKIPNQTDENGWMYAVDFDSKYFRSDWRYCQFIRKRKYIRYFSSATNKTKLEEQKTTNNIDENLSPIEDIKNSNTAETTMMEYVVFEVECREGSKDWKPYQNLWYSFDMRPLPFLSPKDIKLPKPTRTGEWLWAEGWSILMPSLENIQSARAMYKEHNPLLDILKSSRVFLSETLLKIDRPSPTSPYTQIPLSPGISDSEAETEEKKLKSIRRSSISRKKENDKSPVGRTLRIATTQPTLLEDTVDDDIIKDGKFDKDCWMYSQELSSQPFAWKSTDTPSPNQVFRRRIWTRIAVFQTRTGQQTNSPTSETTSTVGGVESAEFLMAELMSALLWHVHLMSHESLVNILPKESAAHIEKKVLGKKKKLSVSTVFYRKRKDLKNEVRKKLTAIKSSNASIHYERITELFFVENLRVRALRLVELITALKGLEFRREILQNNRFYNTRVTTMRHVERNTCKGEGAATVCSKLFELLSDALSEAIFHSWTISYSNVDRNRFLKILGDVGNLFTAVKEAKTVSNVTLLTMLMLACVDSVRSRETTDRNSLWIVDDSFFMQKALSDADHLQILCLFFPDMLTNVKHISRLIHGWLEKQHNINETNAKLCHTYLQGTHRVIESWLKCIHDSVRPSVVTELILLYIEVCTYSDIITKKPSSSNSHFAKFLLEYSKQSILVAYMKIKQHYDAAAILRELSQELPNKNNPTKAEMKVSKIARMKGVSKRDEWLEYIEEIEMLFKADSEICVALWQHKIFEVIPEVGMETLAVEFVSDIINLLSADQESLDIQYRVLLNAASRVQLLLQSLCTQYAILEKEKELQQSISSESLLPMARTNGHSRRESLNEMFGDNNFAARIRKAGESADYQRVDQIFNIVHKELNIRLQHWMEKSLYRCRDFISKAADGESWECHAINKLFHNKKRNSILEDYNAINEMKDESDKGSSRGMEEKEEEEEEEEYWKWRDNRVTWADFVTNSFWLINNEINAYFINLKSFIGEGMSTSSHFYRCIYFLIESILKIIHSSFADIAIYALNSEETDSGNSPQPKIDVLEDLNSRKRAMDQAVHDFHRDIIEISTNVKIEPFSLRTTQPISVLENSLKKLEDQVEDGKEDFSAIPKILKSVIEETKTIHLLDDGQFKKELKYLCVKFSSVSRVYDLVTELGPQLLEQITSMEVPKEEYLKTHFQSCHSELVRTTHKFITDCKAMTKNSLLHAAVNMIWRHLGIQNQHYFVYDLYSSKKIQETTITKSGLLSKINEYFEYCDEYLRYKDLQMLTRCFSSIFNQEILQVLIGPSSHTFKPEDYPPIRQDFDEIYNLLQGFNQDDFESTVFPITEKNHPLHRYYQIVELMQIGTAELMQLHVLAMTEKSEEEEKLLEKEKEEQESKSDPKQKDIDDQELKELYPLSYVAEKGERDIKRLKRIHDHPALYVLAHRNDDEARAYAENFVQFRDDEQSLLPAFLDRPGVIKLIVHCGRKITAVNMNSSCDPYVQVTLYEKTQSTRVARRTSSPKWHHIMEFDLNDVLPIIDKAGYLLITFEVLDWSASSQNIEIGQHKLKLNFKQADTLEEWLPLFDEQNKYFSQKKGELLVSVEVHNVWTALEALDTK